MLGVMVLSRARFVPVHLSRVRFSRLASVGLSGIRLSRVRGSVRPASARLTIPVRLCFALVGLAGLLGAANPAAAGLSTPTGTAAHSRLAPRAWTWPLPGRPAITRKFNPPPEPWLPGHRGVDLAAAAGVPVFAAGPGVVAFAGPVAGRDVVSIDHSSGLRTTYEPVSASVRVGQTVLAGETIGILATGHPGCPVEACLHWGLRRGSTYLDPLVLLGPVRVRLKPLAPVAVTAS
jgi:murein DD-endopeptidase MepM/ murein hydrolase activator NlpD